MLKYNKAVTNCNKFCYNIENQIVMKKIQLTEDFLKDLRIYLDTRPYGEVKPLETMINITTIELCDLQKIADYLAQQRFCDVAALMQFIINAKEVKS